MVQLPTITDILSADTILEAIAKMNSNFAALDIAAGGIEGYGFVRPMTTVGGSADLVLDTNVANVTYDTWIPQTSGSVADAFVNPLQLTTYGLQLITATEKYTDDHWRRAWFVDTNGYTIPQTSGSIVTEGAYGVVALSNDATVAAVKAGTFPANLSIALNPLQLPTAFQTFLADAPNDYADPAGYYGTVVLANTEASFATALGYSDTPIAATPYSIVQFLGGTHNFDIRHAGIFQNTNSASFNQASISSLTITGELNIDSGVDVSFANLTITDLATTTITSDKITAKNLFLVDVNGEKDVNQILDRLVLKNSFTKIMLKEGSISLAMAFASENSQMITFDTDENISITGGEKIWEGNLNRVNNMIRFGMNRKAKGSQVLTAIVNSNSGSGTTEDPYVIAADTAVTLPNDGTYLVRAINDGGYVQTHTNMKVFLNGLLLTPGIDYYEDIDGSQITGTSSTIFLAANQNPGRFTFFLD